MAVLVVVIGFIMLKVASGKGSSAKLSEDLGAIKSIMENLQRMIPEIKNGVELGSETQKAFQQNLTQTSLAVERIKSAYEERKNIEDATRLSIKKLESVITGTTAKGKAGENILRETLRQFPPEMITTGFRVKGQIVEFGLVLPNKKILPIDSKWPAAELLDQLDKEENEELRAKIIDKIEKEVEKRVVKEITQYIDPTLTTPQAIAALPDAVYSVCKKAHVEAYRRNVILISYSMAIPYLLTFLSLNLQYAQNVDVENLSRYLMDIKRNLTEMDTVLENYIEGASSRITNAAMKYRELIGSIRGSLSALEAGKPSEEK
jgi:DNA recombination protein RmuC